MGGSGHIWTDVGRQEVTECRPHSWTDVRQDRKGRKSQAGTGRDKKGQEVMQGCDRK